MKTFKIVLIAILIGLIIALSSGLYLVMSGNSPILERLGITNMNEGVDIQIGGYNNNSTLQNVTELEAIDIQAIDVDLNNTSLGVIFLSSNSNKIVINESYSVNVDNEKYASIDMQNGNLKIKQQLVKNKIWFWGLNRTNGYVEIYLPADVYKNLQQLKVSTTSGKVQGNYIEADDIDISTVSGKIEISSLTGSNCRLDTVSGKITVGNVIGDLRANTVSGKQTIESMDGSVECDTVSGKIGVGEATGGVRVSTVSGKVQVDIKELGGNIDINTTSGGVYIDLPKESSFKFNADSISGNISTYFDNQLSFSKSKHKAYGTVGESTNYKMNIDTTSGKISVQ